MTALGDVARAITSKNAGNFVVAIDVEFDAFETFESVRLTGSLDPESIAEHLRIDLSDVVAVTFFRPGLSAKIAIRRTASSGDVGESDVFGVQQFALVMDLPLHGPAALA